MSKKGKGFERIMGLIQETLKNSPNTHVLTNYLIENVSGRKREIDILITTEVNGFDLKIAIECKDYSNSRKVPVKEIEAFYSKCEQIRSINKKVVISSSGFQEGAVDSAQNFGIELMTTSELTPEVIRQWMPVNQLSMKFITPFDGPVMLIDSQDQEHLENIFESYDGIIHFEEEYDSVHVGKFLVSAVNSNKQLFWKLGLIEWMRTEQSQRFDPISIPFQLDLKNTYIIDSNKNKLTLLGLKTGIKVQFHESPALISEAKSLKDSDGNTKANTFSVNMGNELSADVIVTQNMKTDFYLKTKHGTKKLKQLFSYNPKTDEFLK